MKIYLNYASGRIELPASVLDTDGAGETEYKVLLLFASDPDLCCGYPDNSAELAARIGCPEKEFDMAVSFWRGAGVICVGNGKNAKQKNDTKKENKKPDAKVMSADQLPKYTTEELGNLLEARADAANLIDACEKSIGKMFNPHEVNIVIGLLDYLRLDPEYILTLTEFCARRDKKSLRYIEKMAFTLHDGDITDIDALNDYIKRYEAGEAVEGKLRTMLGIGERALTAKEKKYFSEWVYDYKFGLEMIQKAFEIAVNGGKSKIIDYMNGILRQWHSEGIDTLEKVEAREQARNAEGKDQGQNGTFDTDDFFDAALRRGLGDDYDSVMNGSGKD